MKKECRNCKHSTIPKIDTKNPKYVLLVWCLKNKYHIKEWSVMECFEPERLAK